MAAEPNETVEPVEKDIEKDQVEIAEAAKEAERGDPAHDVRRWLLEATSGTLCTLAAKPELEGWPFGSIVPFALTAKGEPVILIARMAAHTSNLRRDPRASLFVHEPRVDGDPQSGWRATVMGRMERLVPASQGEPERAREPIAVVPDEELAEIHARYLERVPSSEGYFDTHDFDYWRMGSVEKVRYIAGFGKITWLPGESVLRDPLGEGIGEAAPAAIAHMNEDHAHNLLEMCVGQYGFRPAHAEMTALDRTGFFVKTRAPERTLHFSFGREITSAELRHAVIDVLKRARAAG